MSIAEASTLATGAKVRYRNQINLKDFLGSVTTVTPTQLAVTLTTDSSVKNFTLGGDGTGQIPVYTLS